MLLHSAAVTCYTQHLYCTFRRHVLTAAAGAGIGWSAHLWRASSFSSFFRSCRYSLKQAFFSPNAFSAPYLCSRAQWPPENVPGQQMRDSDDQTFRAFCKFAMLQQTCCK